MSSKRIRSLKTLTAPLPQQNEVQRRSTRLFSRVSDLDSRVRIFEPGNALLSSSASSTDEIVEVGPLHNADDTGEELEESVKPSRKRVKLDSGTDIPDIEDVMHIRSPTRSSSQKVVKVKRNMKATHNEGTNPHASTQSPSASSKGRATPSPSKSKSKSPSKLKPIPQLLAEPHPAPPNWRETYDTIKSMRSKFIAPVDTMGCAEAQTGETEPQVSFLPPIL